MAAFSKFIFASTTDAKAVWILTVCKIERCAPFRKAHCQGHTAHIIGQGLGSHAPISTLLICSSSCVVNFTVNLLRRLIERLPLFGGKRSKPFQDAGLLLIPTLGHCLGLL